MKKTMGFVLSAMLLLAALSGAAPAASADTDTTQTQTETAQQTGTIVNCKTQVNVREQASSKSKLLGTAKKGETFTVKGTSGSWVKIDFSGKDGYVYGTYIRLDGTPEDTAAEGKTGTIVNCKTQVNVRE